MDEKKNNNVVNTSYESINAEKDEFFYQEKIQTLLNDGQIFAAHDLARESLELFPQNHIIRQLSALALLNTGAVQDAKEILTPLLEELKLDPIRLKERTKIEGISEDILEFLARIYREIWRNERVFEDLYRSRDLYLQSFLIKPTTSRGINAATLSWLLKDDTEAFELCEKVIELGKDAQKVTAEKIEKDKKSIEKTYIKLVDMARAHLMLGNIDSSINLFRKAREIAEPYFQFTVHTLGHLHFLKDGGFNVPKAIFDIISPPIVVVFSGLKLDRPDQQNTVFPRELEEPVREEIRRWILKLKAKIGYSSAAAGADLIFIEEMLALGNEVNIILPYDPEDFINHNVRYAGARWEARFREAIKKAKIVTYATEEKFLNHEMLYRFANEMIHGLALMRSDFLRTQPHLLTVWNLEIESSVGGAGDFIDHWNDPATLHIIDMGDIYESANFNYKTLKRTITDPDEILEENGLRHKAPPPSWTMSGRVIRSMMFTDLQGYSKLQEENIPAFIEFLHKVADHMSQHSIEPLVINTWGDAVFAVMNKAYEMAFYALHFCEDVQKISKITQGLPNQMNARISLHAGPVFETEDPFLKKTNYYGSHINRAARLEPVTIVGQVYATNQFIALLNAEESLLKEEMNSKGLQYISPFEYQYVGLIPLAKNYGQQPVYHIRWRFKPNLQ